MTWQTSSISSEDTEKLGELLGSLLKPPALIELRSDLGGGKTTFARGLVRGLGNKDGVTSPTFTINRIYKAKYGVKISHFDFYRLQEPGVLADQLKESLEDGNTVTVVEWSGIVNDVLPDKHITVEFSPTPDNPDSRQIFMTYPEVYSNTLKELETNWAKGRP